MDFSSSPSYSGPEDPQTYRIIMVIFTVLKCLFGINIFGHGQDQGTGSLNCGVKAIMLGEAKWKPIEQSLPRNSKP